MSTCHNQPSGREIGAGLVVSVNGRGVEQGLVIGAVISHRRARRGTATAVAPRGRDAAGGGDGGHDDAGGEQTEPPGWACRPVIRWLGRKGDRGRPKSYGAGRPAGVRHRVDTDGSLDQIAQEHPRAGRGEPVGRIRGDQQVDDVVQGPWMPGLPVAVRWAALDRGVKGGAQRPQVGLFAGDAVAQAFRGDVVRCAQQRLGPAGGRGGDGSQAEVGEHDPAVRADQHVAGFDVAVQHAGPVRGDQGVQHGEADPGRVPMGQRTVLGQDILQRAGRHVLHHDPGSAGRLHHIEDPYDTRVVESGGGRSPHARCPA